MTTTTDSVFGIVTGALDRAGQLCSHQMKVFYPAVGHGGITEANQVPLFLHGLQEELKEHTADFAAWVECPFSAHGDRARVDGAAYLPAGHVLFLIEAKRIKQGRSRGELNAQKAVEAIRKDAVRLTQGERLQKFVQDRFSADHASRIVVHRLLMADIWLNTETHMEAAREMWLDGTMFPPEWQGEGQRPRIHETLCIHRTDSGQRYHMLLALHPNPWRGV